MPVTEYLFGYPVKEVPATNFLRQSEQARISMIALNDLHHPRNPEALAAFKRRADTVEPGDVVLLHEKYRDEYTVTPREVKKVNRDQIILDNGYAYSRRTGMIVGVIGGGGSALLMERWITLHQELPDDA